MYSWLLVILVAGLPAMVLHELAHVVTALLLGVRIKSVGIARLGMYIKREPGTDVQNFIISLSAPMFNLLLALISWPHHSWFASNFFEANLVFFIVNIVPISHSDGTRAWKCAERIRKQYS